MKNKKDLENLITIKIKSKTLNHPVSCNVTWDNEKDIEALDIILDSMAQSCIQLMKVQMATKNAK